MSVSATSRREKARKASKALIEIGAANESQEDRQELQKLHGATFESDQPQVIEKASDTLPESSLVVDGEVLLENRITEVLDQIGEGLQADDATNFEKLTIARKYGPSLWDLKALVPHGSFKQKLQERFPKVNYAKCNRWMFLAQNDGEIEAALTKYPDVAWGPKKMIDFLKGFWTPEEEAEADEDDCYGEIREDHVEQEPLFPAQEVAADVPEPDATSPFAVGALNPDLANEIEENQQKSGHVPPGATAGPVTQAVRTRPRPAKGGPIFQPTENRTEYEVEVRLGFKLSVPEHVTAEVVAEAIRHAERWTVGITTPFEYELSEKGIVVGHVRPWNDLEQFQPEAIPSAEVAVE